MMIRFNRPILTIVGGMGPMAGIELHKRILFNTKAQKDQDHFPIQHISYPNLIDDRTDFLLTQKSINPGLQAGYLVKDFTKDKNNKYIIGIPCNTFHSNIIFNLFKNIITFNKPNANVINMVESTVSYLQTKKYKKVGLLCTEGTRKSKIYEDLLCKKKIELIMVPKYKQYQVDNLIYNKKYGIKTLSYANEKVINNTKLIINDLINQDVDCIILGCTELPIAFSDKYFKNIEIVNPIDILAKEMIKRCNV